LSSVEIRIDASGEQKPIIRSLSNHLIWPVADAIKDVQRRGIVLDPFGGSGTIIIAAEKTGRRARAIELDPQYVDVAVRRWQAATGKHALHAETGKVFEDIEEERRGANDNVLIAEGEVA
jgi:tRNA/tmRNA/rRNA uracil-C5-methylase (TrmA/RlmC/RlmD family)